jgi:Domain of unknown function (DUF4332)
MTYKMSEFQGINPEQIEKLREAGIENSDDMMRVWADQPKRTALATQTGIAMDHFTDLASMSRLARVKNVGPKYVGVLVAAGIDGPRSLFEHTPESLVKRLAEVATEKNLTSPVPTLVEVGPWYADRMPVVAAAK